MKNNFLILSVISLISLMSCNVDKPSTSIDNSLESENINNSEFTSNNNSGDDNSNQNNKDNIVDKDGNYLVSSIKKTSSNKTYLEVDGHPFCLIGGQVRIDGLLNRNYTLFPSAMDPLSYEEIEEYFAKAKECNINTLELPLDWKRIEISKDVYDFTLVDKLLSMCNKYDLKCEFLWFSTNMCGDSHEFQLPDYIIYDQETYPRFQQKDEKYTSSLYGDMFFLILNNENLMARETKVLTKLMDYVYQWNIDNDSKNPLIGMQVHNESDNLVRWRLDQRELKLNGQKLDYDYLWNVTLDALDNAGKAIKNSKYKIYTRTNMCVTKGIGSFPQCPNYNLSPLDVLKLEGIDIIGDDPYDENPTVINDTIRAYSVENNYPHIAENMGDYASSPALFLTTYQAGGCYMFYDFVTPQYFVYVNNGHSYQMDQGLLNPDFSYKSHSAETISIISGIAKMGQIIPLVDSSNFAAFNVLEKNNSQNLTQNINTNSLSLTYTTTNGGVAFVIEHDGYAYIYSTKDCSIKINNASYILKAQIGYFDKDNFVEEKIEYLLQDNIAISSDNLYRIKIKSYNSNVTSTTNNYV